MQDWVHSRELNDLVRVSEIPPINLKPPLVRNRFFDFVCLTTFCMACPFGECRIVKVAFLIPCIEWTEECNGGTGRELCFAKQEYEFLNEEAVQ